MNHVSPISHLFSHTFSGTGMKVYPRPGHVYTSSQILQQLTLQDGPSWGFFHLDTKTVGCIQNSHLTDTQLLSVPGFAELKWQYIRTTEEWIPVFIIAQEDYPALMACLDHQSYHDPYSEGPQQWFTPKGFPREP